MTTLTPELIERVKALSPVDKDRLIDLLSEDDKTAFRAELERRIKAHERGEMQSYDRVETMTYLRQNLAEGRTP